ncbi:MAG: hypothetical protein ACLVKA_03300 [Collinsella aerofaciens]
MALSITSATSARVLSGLEQLRGCDAFFSVIISPTDETVRKLGINVCCSPNSASWILSPLNEAIGLIRRVNLYYAQLSTLPLFGLKIARLPAYKRFRRYTITLM